MWSETGSRRTMPARTCSNAGMSRWATGRVTWPKGRWRIRSPWSCGPWIQGRARRCPLKQHWFVGVDWGSQKQQVSVMDAGWEVVGKRAFEHGGRGLSKMAEWLLSVAAGEAATDAAPMDPPARQSLVNRRPGASPAPGPDVPAEGWRTCG